MQHVDPRPALDGGNAGRLLMRRTRELFRVYPKALVGDVEAVHDLRVAARRLRSALALLADNPDGRRARRADKTLRNLARTAGRGRDLDVGLAILESMPQGADEGTVRLRRSLRSSRARARVLSRETLLDLDVAQLRRDLRALAAATRLDREAFAFRHDALRSREESTVALELDLARHGRHPEALHGARRAARRLRYAAELAGLMEGLAPEDADRWRKTQAQLGKIQDRHVLAVWLSSRQALAVLKRDHLLAGAASRALMRVRREAARMAREFFSAPTWRNAAPTPLPEHPA